MDCVYEKEKYGYSLPKDTLENKWPVPVTITTGVLENIVVDALEGQSSYWLGIDNSGPEFNGMPDDLPVSQQVFQLLLLGHQIKCFDIEDEEEQWLLTMDKLLNGVGQALSEQSDITDDADRVLQYALFGEIEYG